MFLLFIDTSTNIFSLYTKNTLLLETHSVSIPNLIHSNIRICLPFRMYGTVFNKLHEHAHPGIKKPIVLSFNITIFLILKKGSPIFYTIALNVNIKNTSKQKSKLLLHNPFQTTLCLLITEFLWIQKDLSTLLHKTNLTSML